MSNMQIVFRPITDVPLSQRHVQRGIGPPPGPSGFIHDSSATRPGPWECHGKNEKKMGKWWEKWKNIEQNGKEWQQNRIFL